MLDDNQTSANNEIELTSRIGVSRWPIFVALAVGIVTALLSISLEYSGFSTSEIAGYVIIAAIFPGILGSIAIAGNVHAFSLWIAAGINCVFYFLIVLKICHVVSRRIVR
jgi:hypothetical protein